MFIILKKRAHLTQHKHAIVCVFSTQENCLFYSIDLMTQMFTHVSLKE